MLSCADTKHDAGAGTGADDHVIGAGRAVDKVPLPQRPLLALDEEQRLARENEEVLLVGFPVVHPDRLARPEDEQGDPDLWELRLALEGQ